jgi:hypothetical protein
VLPLRVHTHSLVYSFTDTLSAVLVKKHSLLLSCSTLRQFPAQIILLQLFFHEDTWYQKYGTQNHPSWGNRIFCETCSSLGTLEAQLHIFWVRVPGDATKYGSHGPFYLILSLKGRVLIIDYCLYVKDYTLNLQLLSLSVQMYDHALLICMHSFYDMHEVNT